MAVICRESEGQGEEEEEEGEVEDRVTGMSEERREKGEEWW